MSEVTRQALARDIARRLQLASHDEVRVVDRILLRLELGRDRYGLLDLSRPRDWRRELAEELLDALIYDTAETIRAEDLAHANLQAAAAEELAELGRWKREDQRTVVSAEPQRIALADTDGDKGPYEEWEIGADDA